MQRFLLPTPNVPRQPLSYVQMAWRATHGNVRSRNFPAEAPQRAPLTGGFTTPPEPKAFSAKKPPAISEELFPMARLHFKIIKCFHHLSALDAGIPKSLVKTAARLQANLHPAFINDDFKATANKASETWLSSIVDGMRSHYRSIIAETETELQELHLSPDSLNTCLTVATTWARRQLGKKLMDSELDSSITFIRSVTPVLRTSGVPPPPQPPSRTRVQQPSVRSIGAQTDCSVLMGTINVCTSLPTTLTSQRPSTPSSARKKRARQSDSISPLRESQMDLFAPPPPPLPARRRVTAHNSSELEILSDTPTDDRLQTPPMSQALEVPAVPTSENESASIPSRIQQPPQLLDTTTASPTVQLNLFGAPASIQKRDSATTATTSARFDDCKENIIFGDSNLCDFQHSSCTVFAHANGRLSHYKALLTATKKPQPHVVRFFICLSTLDSANNFQTNSSTLKSVLGAARRVFPQAQLFVVLLGLDSSLSEETRDNLQALNQFVICKHPSSCLHLTAPSDFAVNYNVWSSASKQFMYTKILGCLNYE